MIKQFLLMALVCTTLLLTACGNLNSIHRPININAGNGALIDVKQRAILVKKNSSGKTIVCAEPSPDALSSYLSDMSLKREGIADGSLKLSENAAFIGLRTQSIQLLRDSYFRLCEAYMNEAITAADYDIQMRRYQQYMIALLSIESLTGAVKAPTVILNTDKAKSDTSANHSSSASYKDVSSSVQSLVEKVLDSDYYGQLCWSLLTKSRTDSSKNAVSPKLVEACGEFFKIKNEHLKKLDLPVKKSGNHSSNMSVKSFP